jgi:hypothetical protein
MAQKLLLFWRKPARRCWWEGVELDNVEGLEGKKLKVWIRRVWTLEMVCYYMFYTFQSTTNLKVECYRAALNIVMRQLQIVEYENNMCCVIQVFSFAANFVELIELSN